MKNNIIQKTKTKITDCNKMIQPFSENSYFVSKENSKIEKYMLCQKMSFTTFLRKLSISWT